MKTKPFILLTITAITILILAYCLLPNLFIPTLIITSFTYGFFQVMCYKKNKYKRRAKPLDYPGWAVPHNSQTPIRYE